ncbi:hypothetical protein KCP71_01230 [Salmonella enterica subsp. enterica]|nr:hypothetical protein KCP71_01230 [Salmonella enterica subsp. enterica]
MSALLAEHQVHLHIQEIDYDQWHAGDIESDIRPIALTLRYRWISLFAHLCEVPLLAELHSARLAGRRRAARWRDEPANWCRSC